MKLFNVKRGCGFINGQNTRVDNVVHRTTVKKNNPMKYLKTVEFDVVIGQQD